MKRTKVCKNYCGVACIDGSCPIANKEEYEWRGYDVINSCDDCGYCYDCEDCCFENTEMCVKYIEERKD